MDSPHSGGRRQAKGPAALKVRLFIAAQVRLYREGLADLLAREDGIDVVGMASNRLETVARACELQPDVVLLDQGMPESMETILALRNSAAGAKVVALATPGTEDDVITLAEAGFSGFVTYDECLSDLVGTLRSVAHGDLVCSPRMAGALLRRVTALAAGRSMQLSDPQLTAREFEVVRLIDEGLSNKQIAGRLFIELATVKHHVHHILEKLGVARRSEAAARLRQRGLIYTKRR